MSWSVVARRELRVAMGSTVSWLLGALFVVVAAGRSWTLESYLEQTYVGATDPSQYQANTAALAGSLVFVVTALVSLIAIVVAHRTIAGERDSGAIKLQLTGPHGRSEVYAAKALVRCCVAAIPVLLGLLAAAAIGLIRHDQFSVLTFLAFGTLTVAFTMAFVSVALALSTATPSSSESTAGAFAVYLLLGIGWIIVVDIGKSMRNLLVEGEFQSRVIGSEPPDWFGLLEVAGPSGAYRRLVTDWVWYPEDPFMGGGTVDAWQDGTGIAAVSLVLWIVVPFLLGLVAFRRADL